MERAKQNELDAYARNVIRYKARRLIGRYGLGRDDYEDLQQELALDLLQRLPRFDSARGSMRTFISRIVNHKIATLIRHRTQEKRDWRLEACSLDEPRIAEEGDAVTRHEIVSQDACDLLWGRNHVPEVDRIDLRIDLGRAMEGLSPNLRALAELLGVLSITDVARYVRVPRATLYETGIARLREYFGDRGLRDYL